MTVRTIQEILSAAGKRSPEPGALGATDAIMAAAILAQAIDRHTEAVASVAAALLIIAEKPK
jgi:hypothetical protein